MTQGCYDSVILCHNYQDEILRNCKQVNQGIKLNQKYS
jgi:hypothetical protein